MPWIVEVRAGRRASSWQASVAPYANLDLGSDKFVLERYCFSSIDTNNFVCRLVIRRACCYYQAVLLSFLGSCFVVAATVTGCCFECSDGGGHFDGGGNFWRLRACWSKIRAMFTSKTVHAYASTWKLFGEVIGVQVLWCHDVTFTCRRLMSCAQSRHVLASGRTV